MVLYFVSTDVDFEKQALYDEREQQRGKKGRPLAKKLRNGIEVPRYHGFVVVDKDFTLSYTPSADPSAKLKDLVKEYNAYGKEALVDIAVSTPPPAYRWTWNGIRIFLYRCSYIVDSLVYTMGIPPDPNYKPAFAKTWHWTLENLSRFRAYPPKGACDATITNLKPGMKTMQLKPRDNLELK